MTEIQRKDEGRESSLPVPFDPEALRLRLAYFGYTAVPSAILLEIMTQGQLGDSVAVAAMLGGAACYWGPQLHKVIGPGMRAAGQMWDYLNRNNSGRVKHHLMDKNWWLTGEVSAPYADEQEPEEGEGQEEGEGREEKPLQGKMQKLGKGEVRIPGKFDLDSVLSVMRDFNDRSYIYFGESEGGSIAVPLNKMYHVMDVSSSGKGKSNRFRHAMMQLVGNCEVYYINPIAAGVKGVTDWREVEVWQPIYDRLANKRPLKQGPEIEEQLQALANLIDERNAMENAQDFSWMDEPVFVFVDEQPEVFRICPNAAELLDKIGRMGRNYLVFMWIATQTAQVTDIGLSTATQAQIKTRIYGGSDATSAGRTMKGVSAEQERILTSNGEGLTLILGDGLTDLTFTRSPLVTNEAMFDYLELGPFKKSDWLKKGAKKATSTTSTQEGDSTSIPTSTATSNLSDGEVAGNGTTGSRKWREVDQPLPHLSELEKQIGDLFFMKRQKKSKIIEMLYPPNARGGNANIKASEEIDEAIRRYAEVTRHQAIQMMRSEKEL